VTALERVSVNLAGQSFAGWSDVSITIGADRAARTASLTVSDYGGAVRFLPGDPCTITANGDLVLTGYIRDVSPSHSSESHSVAIGVVSRTVDAVEASIKHPTSFVRDKSLDGIAQDFDTSGVGIEVDESFPVEPASFVNLGESLFRHLEPLARAHSALIYDTAEGKLRIRKGIRGRHSGALRTGPGGNIIEGSAKLTEGQRFSPVIVRGQTSRGAGAGALRLEAQAIDAAVKRNRPKILILEGEATAAKLKERAERYVKRAAGLSATAEITLSGWRDEGGRIFEPHFIVAVEDPRLYLNQEMAIKSVTLTQSIARDGPGTRAQLSLCDPRALNGEASAAPTNPDAPASGEAWSAPAPAGVVGLDY
jgi:prophage tail gpP-like protein